MGKHKKSKNKKQDTKTSHCDENENKKYLVYKEEEVGT